MSPADSTEKLLSLSVDDEIVLHADDVVAQCDDVIVPCDDVITDGDVCEEACVRV